MIKNTEQDHVDMMSLPQNKTDQPFTDQQKSEKTQDKISSEVNAKLTEEHDKFLDYLHKGDFEGLVQIIGFFRRWLSYQSPPSSDIPDEILKLAPHLLHLLSDDSSSEHKSLHSEITWLLANISAGTNKEAQILVELDVIQVLACVFQSTSDDEIQENIMWTLANIAEKGNLEYRDQMLEHGILDLVVGKFSKALKKPDYAQNAVWLVSNIVQIQPSPSFEQVKPLFVFFKDLLDYDDEEVEEHVLRSLAALTEDAQEVHVKYISELGLSLKIVKLIKAQGENISINAIKVIDNLIKAKRGLKHDFNHAQLFGALTKTIACRKTEMRKQSCLILLNVLSEDQFVGHSSLESSQILQKLIKIASIEQNEIGVQATLCLKKFIETASQEYVISAVKKGVVEVLFNNLNTDNAQLIENSLCVLHKLLDFGGILKEKHDGNNFIFTKLDKCELKNSIESLESHQNEKIAHEAEIILSTFFTKIS